MRPKFHTKIKYHLTRSMGVSLEYIHTFLPCMYRLRIERVNDI